MGAVACSSHTISQLLTELRTLLRDKTLHPRTILTLNAHIYNCAVKDAALRRSLNAARVTTADGMGIVWTSRFFGVRIPERCNMTEAFRAFLIETSMPSSKAILIGCGPEVAEAAAVEINLHSAHCCVVNSFSGYLTDEEYCKIFEQNKTTDFILLGMGTPRTESIAEFAGKICPETIVWGIGGGTIRILAGAMREAPPVWRRFGLQWLHRLFSEPRQLWCRYLIGNPLFAWRILKAALTSQR